MNMIDLHVHLLPGVDDGPATVARSISHARRMAGDGVREAVVTPHVGHPEFAVDVREILPRTEWLNARLRELGILVRLRPGGELHASAAGALDDVELELIAQGPAGRRWVLLEAPFDGIGEGFVASVLRLGDRGYGVVVAHPERSPHGLELLDDLDVVLQVGADSLLGHHGTGPRARAEMLLFEREALLIGSDGHGGMRTQTLLDGHEAAIACGTTIWRAQELTTRGPQRLLRHGLRPARALAVA